LMLYPCSIFGAGWKLWSFSSCAPNFLHLHVIFFLLRQNAIITAMTK
jgi:hypothetical protein